MFDACNHRSSRCQQATQADGMLTAKHLIQKIGHSFVIQLHLQRRGRRLVSRGIKEARDAKHKQQTHEAEHKQVQVQSLQRTRKD